MQKKLTLNAVGLKKKINHLLSSCQTRKDELPQDHLREYRSLDGFIADLEFILEKIKQIEGVLIPLLEKDFRIRFKTPELVLLAFSSLSMKNVFDVIQAYFQSKELEILTNMQFIEISASHDASKVLALVGDAALSLSTVEVVWDSSLATVGGLSQRRDKIISNKNLSKTSDKYNLIEFIIGKKDPGEPLVNEELIYHLKATLVEAILGIIYLEYGLEEIFRIVPMLQE